MRFWPIGGSMNRALLAIAFSLSFFSYAGIQSFVTDTRTVHQIFVEAVDEELVQVEGQPFVRLSLRGVYDNLGIEYQEGYPEIPVIRFAIEGEGEIRVEVGPEVEIESKTQAPVIPNIEALPRKSRRSKNLWMAAAGYSDNYFPSETYRIKEVGSRRGRTVRTVTLFPVRYSQGKKRYNLRSQFRVSVDGQKMDLPTREGLLFVVGKEFEQSIALKNYREFKNSLGYDVLQWVVSDDAKNPDAIRAKVKEFYASKPTVLTHLILIGDQEHIPGYQTSRVLGVTDHYYRAIDTDDYEKDLGTPDLLLGRISVSSETDLENILGRSMLYESGGFLNTQWLQRAMTIATDDTANYQESETTLNLLIDTLLSPLHYFGSFPASLPGADKLYAISHKATGDDVVKHLKEGRGFVTYAGHGGTDEWSGPRVTSAMLSELSHPHAIPFVSSHACFTGNFVEDSFAEAWIRNPHGAVAIWASMDVDFWGVGDVFERMYYDNLFKRLAKDFGSLGDKTVRDFWTKFDGEGKSAYYWEDYVTFGDPSISFRMAAPKTAKIQAVNLTACDGIVFSLSQADGQPLPKDTRVAVIAPNHSRTIHYMDGLKQQIRVSRPCGNPLKGWRVVVSGGDVKTVWNTF